MRTTSLWALLPMLLALSVLAQDVRPVEVSTPIERSLSEQVTLAGTVMARHDAALSSREAGLIAELLVDVGDEVSEGQALLRLDTALAEHELAQRRATLRAAQVAREEAERRVAEAERLADEKVFPQTELEVRRAAVAQAAAVEAQAQAAVSQQRETLARHTLTAPFNGVIAARQADVGEYVALGNTVFRLVSLESLVLDVQVPQEYFPALARLGRVVVKPDIDPDRELSATLLRAVPVGDVNVRSFQVRLLLDDDRSLFPGASANAVLQFQGVNGAVYLVPPDALLHHADGNFSVFTVRDGKAHRHRVTVGRTSEQGVEILGGLPSGEPVVVRGNEVLQDGESVRIAEPGA